MNRFYAWTMEKAASPHAVWWLAFVSFLESSIFPIPPDVLLIPMVLAAPTRWFRLAMVCTLSSVVGGYAGYAIGYFFMDTLGMAIVRAFEMEAAWAQLQPLVDKYGVWVIIAKGATPLPYKLITIAAGALNFNLAEFGLASFLSRGIRFFPIAFLLWKFGPSMRHLIETRLKQVLLACLMIVVVIVAFVQWY